VKFLTNYWWVWNGNPNKSFFIGIFFAQIGGSYLNILLPNFIKSLFKISYNVGLSAGFFTKIFLIKSIAYCGTTIYFGKEY
jgi:hypothetical protein